MVPLMPSFIKYLNNNICTYTHLLSFKQVGSDIFLLFCFLLPHCPCLMFHIYPFSVIHSANNFFHILLSGWLLCPLHHRNQVLFYNTFFLLTPWSSFSCALDWNKNYNSSVRNGVKRCNWGKWEVKPSQVHRMSGKWDRKNRRYLGVSKSKTLLIATHPSVEALCHQWWQLHKKWVTKCIKSVSYR